MAYMDMKRYPEAEKWLTLASNEKKTRLASEYNLGRIAFETKRYKDALARFEKLLSLDPDNVMALKAAAYTKIKLNDLEGTLSLYKRILELSPESADDGYNYALVLYALEQYEESEAVLVKYPFALDDNKDVLLLYARVQRVQNKPDAADSYAKYLETNSDAKVRYEYAASLEIGGFYARALEEYRAALKDLPADSKDPLPSAVRFGVSRVLLIADPQNEDGITELQGAVAEGFEDIPAVEALLEQDGITAVHKDTIRSILERMQDKAQEKEKQEKTAQEETSEAGTGSEPKQADAAGTGN
jgi:tetratricopeptide (TPR) repeat protein